MEVDLATESLPSIAKKLKRYVDYQDTGAEQERLSGVFPRVLWHCPDPERRQRLDELLDDAPGPEGLFVTTGLIESIADDESEEI